MADGQSEAGGGAAGDRGWRAEREGRLGGIRVEDQQRTGGSRREAMALRPAR